MRAAFTLVELAVVLVIIGLLVGGVLVGQSLIHAAELRSVTGDYTRFITATRTFQGKYRKLPGDMTNATTYFAGTVNGNGDEIVCCSSTESLTYWQQLTLAGLLSGGYTGVGGPGGAGDNAPDISVPRSRLGNNCWSVSNLTYGASGASWRMAYNYNNYLLLGAPEVGYYCDNRGSQPADAYEIDTKIDDGWPAKGKMIAGYYGTSASNSCFNATSNTDYTGAYYTTNTRSDCIIYFTQVF